MQIGRKDLFWNYAATSMRILSGVIILPVILRMFPSEEVGIWGIFLSLMGITALLDFGFSNSFSRNITYVYSGAKELKVKGYSVAETSEIDYGLLKSLLLAMKRYYGIMAIVFLIIFLSVSPFYMSSILAQYTGDNQSIWIAWYIFGGVLTYELYTYYYGSILQGRGLVKRNMQILILSLSIRIVATLIFLFVGLGFISLVLGILIGSLIYRALAYYIFYDKKTKANLTVSASNTPWNMIKTLTPNSLKLGLTFLGIFLRTKAIALMAPLYLSLSEFAQYTISKQIVDLIVSLGIAWFFTFYPKLSQYSIRESRNDIKRLYIKGTIILLLTFIVLGTGAILFGDPVLVFIKSKTLLLPGSYLFLMLLFSFLEQNQGIAANIFLAKNEVPFFKSNLISGVLAVLFLFLMLKYTNLGVLSLILSTGLALSLFLNWYWPMAAAKQLNLTVNDYVWVIKEFWEENLKKIKLTIWKR